MSLNSKRRFYLLKWLAAERRDEPTADRWREKHLAEPGTALPANFPFMSALTSRGYTTVQDLDGAPLRELARVGLRGRDADEVLKALAALT